MPLWSTLVGFQAGTQALTFLQLGILKCGVFLPQAALEPSLGSYMQIFLSDLYFDIPLFC